MHYNEKGEPELTYNEYIMLCRILGVNSISQEDIKTILRSNWGHLSLKKGVVNKSGKLQVLLIEDDAFVARDYERALTAIGCEIHKKADADSAILFIKQYRDILDVVVIDIRLPHGDCFDLNETGAGIRTGLLLLDEIYDLAPDLYVFGLTNSTDEIDTTRFELSGKTLCKKNQYTPERFANLIKRNVMKIQSTIRTFIVHGHDMVATLELKNYLQNVLRLPEPTILAEQKSNGMTLIEKFEYYADKADLVFSILTPDDGIVGVDNHRRARPNVIFELGYFMGRLGRKSGKVFMLYKQGVEIPTDLLGIIYIDITNGVLQASEDIRKEIDEYIGA